MKFSNYLKSLTKNQYLKRRIMLQESEFIKNLPQCLQRDYLKQCLFFCQKRKGQKWRPEVGKWYCHLQSNQNSNKFEQNWVRKTLHWNKQSYCHRWHVLPFIVYQHYFGKDATSVWFARDAQFVRVISVYKDHLFSDFSQPK